MEGTEKLGNFLMVLSRGFRVRDKICWDLKYVVILSIFSSQICCHPEAKQGSYTLNLYHGLSWQRIMLGGLITADERFARFARNDNPGCFLS